MYVTKKVNPRIVAAALRSVCNQAGPEMDYATAQAVGQLANQLMQDGHPMDALEGSIAAEYVHMVVDNLPAWEHRVEILGH